MFLSKPACTSRIFNQQVMRLATQPSLTQRSVASTLPLKTLALKNSTISPIVTAVRSFRTSMVRMSEEKGHDHSKLWVIEKVVSAAMVPLIPIALMVPNKITDSVLAILITAHTFWGLEAIAVDYVRASIFGPVIPKIAIGFVYALCIATLGGLFYVISHDVGISNTVRQIWAIKPELKA